MQVVLVARVEEDQTEDQDVEKESEVILKQNEKSSDMVKFENDEDTDACFSSDEEEDQNPSSGPISHQKPEVKNEPNTSTEDFDVKTEIRSENKDLNSSSDEEEPVRRKKREMSVNGSSDEDNPKKSLKKRKLEDSSSEDDQPVKRKKSSINQKSSKNHAKRSALESSEDEEFDEDDDAFEEDEVELKPPPKTCLIDEEKTEEISKILEKIRRKWTILGKIDKSFYLRFKIRKPLDLPNDQQCKFRLAGGIRISRYFPVTVIL